MCFINLSLLKYGLKVKMNINELICTNLNAKNVFVNMLAANGKLRE